VEVASDIAPFVHSPSLLWRVQEACRGVRPQPRSPDSIELEGDGDDWFFLPVAGATLFIPVAMPAFVDAKGRLRTPTTLSPFLP
jgi:hypothetical protein